MGHARLIHRSTLVFLAAVSAIMLGAALWTGNYWAGDSMIADAVRAKSGYFGGIFELVGDGEIPLGPRLKLLLFVTAPLSCGILSTLAAGLFLLQMRGKATWRPASALAALLLLGTWFGVQSLRLIEDRSYYDNSPWVSTFKAFAFPLAALALAYLLCIAVVLVRSKLPPKPAATEPTA